MIITRNTVLSLLSRPNITDTLPEFGRLISQIKQSTPSAPKPGCSSCGKSRGPNIDVANNGMAIINSLPKQQIVKLRELLHDEHLYVYAGTPPVLIELGI